MSRPVLSEVFKASGGFVVSVALGVFFWALHASGTLREGESLVLFATGNLVIVAGYMFAAVFVGPRFRDTDMRTKVGGFFFFLLCGLTHLEMALHAMLDENGITTDDMLSLHMLLIHTVQAWAIWEFLLGLARYFRSQEAGDQ